MRHRTKTETYGRWIKLVKKTNPKTGRKHYSVIADTYLYFGGYPKINREPFEQFIDSWREHFDPGGNRSARGALSWKFSNRAEAEQLITLALLKWGDQHVA